LKQLFGNPPTSLMACWAALEKLYACSMHNKPFVDSCENQIAILRCNSIASLFSVHNVGCTPKLHDVGFHYSPIISVGGVLGLEQALEHQHSKFNKVEVHIRSIIDKELHTKLAMRRSLASQSSDIDQDTYCPPKAKRRCTTENLIDRTA